MQYDIFLSWRHMRRHPVQTLVPITIVALAVALSVAVLALGSGVREGIIRASDPFGVLVVGPKGDGQQLVLDSVLLQGTPLGTIPYEIYEDLENDPQRVQFAVPMAKGDNLAGAQLIGTNQNFFRLRTHESAPPAFQIAQGETFSDPFEAVLGSQVAQDTGLTVGDRFQSSHGTGRGIASDQHEDIYTIVGILQPSGTPYDRAVFTPLESIWDAHSDHDDDEHHEDEAAADADHDDEHHEDEAAADADHDDEHHEDEAGESAGSSLEDFAVDQAAGDRELTSILVKPTGFAETNQIWQDFYTGTEAQAAFPGQELGALFDLLQQAEEVLSGIGYFVLGIAGLTLFLSIYSTTNDRRQEIAIMRSLGSRRATVFRMVIVEALVIALVGSVLGRILGYGAASLIATQYTTQSAIQIPITFLSNLEPVLWVLTIIVGVIAGLVPALMAYRVDVVKNLFRS